MIPPPAVQIDQAWLSTNFPDLAGVRLIGRGGQKWVFAGVHPVDGAVVLKLIPGQNLEEVRREVLAVQQVQSPRVPALFADGEVPTPLGPCYWVRERHIEGVSVRDALVGGPLTAPEVLRLGRHVLEALVRAEQVQIVHRDVKPDNIMRDVAGNFWLLDFGIARHLTLDSLTATAAAFGKMTLGYAPPEQIRNDKQSMDSRTDLFALGVTLYESATGANPFRAHARDDFEILRRAEQQAVPRLTLPIANAAEFGDLVEALMQKRRDLRPRTAQEAAEWLEEICLREGVA